MRTTSFLIATGHNMLIIQDCDTLPRRRGFNSKNFHRICTLPSSTTHARSASARRVDEHHHPVELLFSGWPTRSASKAAARETARRTFVRHIEPLIDARTQPEESVPSN